MAKALEHLTRRANHLHKSIIARSTKPAAEAIGGGFFVGSDIFPHSSPDAAIQGSNRCCDWAIVEIQPLRKLVG
jgi:hypothetical protein